MRRDFGALYSFLLLIFFACVVRAFPNVLLKEALTPETSAKQRQEGGHETGVKSAHLTQNPTVSPPSVLMTAEGFTSQAPADTKKKEEPKTLALMRTHSIGIAPDREENHLLGNHLQKLYSDPPGEEFRYFRGDDRRRRNARIMRAPVKRSAARPMTPRNKRDLQLDADDALTLLALWASTSPGSRPYNDMSMRREGFGHFIPSAPSEEEVMADYESPEENALDESDVMMPGGGGDEDNYPPAYTGWGDSEYPVPDRFNVMRRSPALYPILGPPYKREPGYGDMPSSSGRWGALLPTPHKRFMVSKRRQQSAGDVYSLAQLLSDQRPEPTLPLYRRLAL